MTYPVRPKSHTTFASRNTRTGTPTCAQMETERLNGRQVKTDPPEMDRPRLRNNASIIICQYYNISNTSRDVSFRGFGTSGETRTRKLA